MSERPAYCAKCGAALTKKAKFFELVPVLGGVFTFFSISIPVSLAYPVFWYYDLAFRGITFTVAASWGLGTGVIFWYARHRFRKRSIPPAGHR